MNQIESTEAELEFRHDDKRDTRAMIGVICGALGIAAAVWAYWLLLPGVVLGCAALALGVWSRRHGVREAGSVAVALGIVAVLLVPSVLVVVSGAENWGRDCALHPSNPDC